MADKSRKVAGCVDGLFYVDENCTGCGLCESTASNNFRMDGNGMLAIVYKQPSDDAEKKACRTALEECPVEAIGDDGK